MVKFSNKMWKWPLYTDEEVNSVVEMVRQGEVSFSKEPQYLEAEFRSWNGSRYCLSAVNGTASLHMGFFGAGIKRGDRIIAPTYTHWATVAPALHIGAHIDFVGFDKNTLLPDTDEIICQISTQTRAVVITHLWGNIFPVEELSEFLREKGIVLIEDCSHAHGASYKSQRMVGADSEVACFSLQANKILPAGEGGLLCSNSERIINKAITFGLYERLKLDSPFYHTGLGYKYRINPLNATIARAGLRKIESILVRRRHVFSQLSQAIPKKILRTDEKGALYALVIEVEDENKRNQLFKDADQCKIPLGTAQYPLLHKTAAFIEISKNKLNDEKMCAFHRALVVMPLPIASEENQLNDLSEWFYKNLSGY